MSDKENIDSKNSQKVDFFEDIIKELERNKFQNESNVNTTEIKEKMDIQKEDMELRMKQLKDNLKFNPNSDYEIPLNNNASLSIIQELKDKKENNNIFQNILSKINILKWLKAYSILFNKEVQSVNICLSKLRNLYSFDSSNSNILCEIKNMFIIDCYQLLDVIDANFVCKKIILTKNVKKDSKDKGKITIVQEYFVNIGDLILFKKPQSCTNFVLGEEYLEVDVKDVNNIVPFDF